VGKCRQQCWLGKPVPGSGEWLQLRQWSVLDASLSNTRADVNTRAAVDTRADSDTRTDVDTRADSDTNANTGTAHTPISASPGVTGQRGCGIRHLHNIPLECICRSDQLLSPGEHQFQFVRRIKV
jgi:hypothetical protein